MSLSPLKQSFLSRDMTYSCAIWPDSAGGVRGDLTGEWREEDLEIAQLFKIHNLLKKARLRPGDRLLEFGTGWGALAIEVSPQVNNQINRLKVLNIGGKNGMRGRYADAICQSKSCCGTKSSRGIIARSSAYPSAGLPEYAR